MTGTDLHMMPAPDIRANALDSVYNDAENRLRWKHANDMLVMACGRCGVQWFNDWDISDDAWEAGRHGHNVLCRPCFDLLGAREALATIANAKFTHNVVDSFNTIRAIARGAVPNWRNASTVVNAAHATFPTEKETNK